MNRHSWVHVLLVLALLPAVAIVQTREQKQSCPAPGQQSQAQPAPQQYRETAHLAVNLSGTHKSCVPVLSSGALCCVHVQSSFSPWFSVLQCFRRIAASFNAIRHLTESPRGLTREKLICSGISLAARRSA